MSNQIKERFKVWYLLVVLSECISVYGFDVPIDRHWDAGFKADFCAPISKDMNVWRGHLVFDRHIEKLKIFKADIVETLENNREFVLMPNHGHFTVHNGDQVCMNFVAYAEGTGSTVPEVRFFIEGMDKGYTTKPYPSGILWHKNTFNPSNPKDGFLALNPGSFNENSLSVDNDPEGGSGKVIKISIKKGHYVKVRDHRGSQFYTSTVNERESLTLSYQVYFNKDMDWVRGGKLPGLYGGATNCTGGRHSDACLTTRFMWRPGGQGEIYAYMPPAKDQRAGFCDLHDVVCNPVYGMSLGRGSWSFRTGRWETIAQHIHLNTPGHHDGYAKVWFNGKLVYEMKQVNFRNNSKVKLKGLFFSVFFGGSKESWAPTADSQIYFKNFILSSFDENPPQLMG